MVKDDPSDNRILECAQAAEVDFLVSGDEHLLALGRLGRTRIVSASDFLKAS
jgi:predicted nucleic acid-binding protein